MYVKKPENQLSQESEEVVEPRELKRVPIKAPVEAKYISEKKMAGQRIQYVAWYDIAELLDSRIGGKYWNWIIDSVSQINVPDNLSPEAAVKNQAMNLVVVVGKLEVIYQESVIIRMATGTEPILKAGYGDAVSSAEASAFRRAAAKLGIGRELWRK